MLVVKGYCCKTTIYSSVTILQFVSFQYFKNKHYEGRLKYKDKRQLELDRKNLKFIKLPKFSNFINSAKR